MEMMDEGPGGLRELLRLPDFLVVCSSTGWTDEKHMLYLQLLEETFVSQLHGGECSFKELFNRSPRNCRRVKSSKHTVKYAKPDQGCPGIVDTDRIKSGIKIELRDSTSCGDQQDGKVHSMDDDASTTEPVEESTTQSRATCSVQSSTCYVGKHRHSPSRSAEGSDQNFGEETKGIGESRRGCSQKRLKSSDVRDDQVVPSLKAESQEAGGLSANGGNKDKWDGLLKAGAEAGSPSCKEHGPKG